MTKFQKIMVLLIVVPCLALFVGCTGDVGPAGAPGAKGGDGAKGDKGDKGDPGEKGEKGDEWYRDDPTITLLSGEEATAENLLKVLKSRTLKSYTIIIEDDILDFDSGTDGDLMIAEAGFENNLLGYDSAGPTFSHYFVDPIVIEGKNATAQQIIGIPKANGDYPKINASFVIDASYVQIANLEIAPDIAVCEDGYLEIGSGIPGPYYSVTGAAIAMIEKTRTANYVCTDDSKRYAGVVVKNGGQLDMIDSIVDMSNAASLSRTVSGAAIYAQVDDDAEPFAAVLVDNNADTFAGFDGAEVTNIGKYGLYSEFPSVTPWDYNVEIYGGKFDGAENSIKLNLGMYTVDPALGTLTLPTGGDLGTIPLDDLDLAPAVASSLSLGLSNVADLKDLVSGSAIDLNILLDGGMFSGFDYLVDLGVGDLFSVDVSGDLAAYEAGDFQSSVPPTCAPGCIIDDLLDDIVGGSEDITNYLDVEAAFYAYVEFLALDDVMSSGYESDIYTDRNNQVGSFSSSGALRDAADAWIEQAIDDAAEALIDASEYEDKAKELLKDAILEVPELVTSAAIKWEYKYDYDYDHNFDFDYDYSYTYTFDVEYDDPLGAPGDTFTFTVTYTIEYTTATSENDSSLGLGVPGVGYGDNALEFDTKADLEDWLK